MDEDLLAKDSVGRVVLCETALLVREGVAVRLLRVLLSQAGLGVVVALDPFISSVFDIFRVPVPL